MKYYPLISFNVQCEQPNTKGKHGIEVLARLIQSLKYYSSNLMQVTLATHHQNNTTWQVLDQLGRHTKLSVRFIVQRLKSVTGQPLVYLRPAPTAAAASGGFRLHFMLN